MKLVKGALTLVKCSRCKVALMSLKSLRTFVVERGLMGSQAVTQGVLRQSTVATVDGLGSISRLSVGWYVDVAEGRSKGGRVVWS